MLKHCFVRLIKELSPNFKFYAPIDEYSNASLWYIYKQGMEQQLISAVPDEADIPEYSMKQKDEFLKHRGWRAILRIIADAEIEGHKIVDREHFWKVLHKHGIYDIKQAIQWETDCGSWHTKQTGYFNEYKQGGRLARVR